MMNESEDRKGHDDNNGKASFTHFYASFVAILSLLQDFSNNNIIAN